MNRNQPTAVVPFDVKLMNITATVMFMGCLTACVMAGWWLMRTPAFNIGRIVVEGELVQQRRDAARQCGASAQGQLLHGGPEGGQQAFEQVPWVQEAQVRREYPNGLRVALKEHVAEAFWG
jgi:cell division protein FtsQ